MCTNRRQRRLRFRLNAVSVDWPLVIVNFKYFIIPYMLYTVGMRDYGCVSLFGKWGE